MKSHEIHYPRGGSFLISPWHEVVSFCETSAEEPCPDRQARAYLSVLNENALLILMLKSCASPPAAITSSLLLKQVWLLFFIFWDVGTRSSHSWRQMLNIHYGASIPGQEQMPSAFGSSSGWEAEQSGAGLWVLRGCLIFLSCGPEARFCND